MEIKMVPIRRTNNLTVVFLFLWVSFFSLCCLNLTMLKARNFTEEEIELLSNFPYVKDVKRLLESIKSINRREIKK